MSQSNEKNNKPEHKVYSMVITVYTEEDDFTLDKMFSLIAEALQNDKRHIAGSPANQK